MPEPDSPQTTTPTASFWPNACSARAVSMRNSRSWTLGTSTTAAPLADTCCVLNGLDREVLKEGLAAVPGRWFVVGCVHVVTLDT